MSINLFGKNKMQGLISKIYIYINSEKIQLNSQFCATCPI